MDRTQADAIVQALMEPDLRAQAEIRRKRAAEAAQLARSRRVAGCALVGCGIGAAVIHFGSGGISTGVVWGGVIGAAIGWLVTWRSAV